MQGEDEFNAGATPASEIGWWAVYTKHQHEKVSAEILSLKGAEVFLPLYSSIRRWKDRNITLSLPLFPSYVFVRAQPDVRLKVLSTPGIFTIVTHGTQLAVVSHREIQSLRRAVQGPQPVGPYPFLRTGEKVQITRGALSGVEGILVRQKNLCRVVISVEMLAHSAAVEVNAWDVAPVTLGRKPEMSTSAEGYSRGARSDRPDSYLYA